MKLKTTICTLALLAFASSAFAQKKYDIKVNLKKETTLTMTTKSESTLDINGMGQNIQLPMKNDMVTSINYIPLKNGDYKVTYTTLKAEMTQDMSQMGAGIVKLSSEDELNDQNKILKATIKIPLVFEMTQDGRIVKAPDFTEYFNKLKEAANNNISIDKVASDIDFGNNMYPGKPVAVGESWKFPSKDFKIRFNQEDKAIKFSNDMTFTLKDVTSDMYIIDATIKLNTDIEGLDLLMNGTYTFYVDRNTGLMLKSESKAEGQTEKDGMNIKVRQTTKLTTAIK